MTQNQKIRNVAIIAHVDHGKTTLVDKLMQFCNLFREHQVVEECFLDSNDQEKERGITILAKNIALHYKDTKINFIDTPGHADFSGEVERTLKLADGALLLVDSFEGVRPQTRYVLKKALEAGLKPIVIINKMDRKDRRPKEALDTVSDLFLEVSEEDHHLEFPVLYVSGREGWASTELEVAGTDLQPLMDKILDYIPAPEQIDGPLQLQFTSFDHNDYVGLIGIGRVHRGTLKANKNYTLCKEGETINNIKIKEVYTFNGLDRVPTAEVSCGDLCALVGVSEIEIGDTLTDPEAPEPIERPSIDAPTLSMLFKINDSPLFGKDGKFVTSRHLAEALKKADEKDVSLRVEKGESEGEFRVYGRGILHMGVLIENLRRNQYELAVGQPQVIFKEENGVTVEPWEELSIEVGENFAGKVMEAVAVRKGKLQHIDYLNDAQILSYHITSRGLIGLRSQLLNICSGHLVMMHRFMKYGPLEDIPPRRSNGSMISMEAGNAVPYALNNLQDRGVFFVNPGDITYPGMIVGEHCKAGDLTINLQKEKKLSNMRASGKDKELRIAPARKMSLEECMEFISDDELVEVTPNFVRIRKIKLR